MKPCDLPYLSIVAASRNDDHGGDPLRRTQIFVNALFAQCQKHRLPAELILVDWNPPPDRPRLREALDFRHANDYCAARVIEVPAAIHQRLEYGDKLPFFQMIAKNVGIRNARGRFIVATNIDILFSDELIIYLAGQRLNPERMYRVDRYDVANTIPAEAPLGSQLKFCWESLIRVHRRRKTVATGQNGAVARGEDDDGLKGAGLWHHNEADGPAQSVVLKRDAPPEYVHTNACGDFTLLSREQWHRLRGYPEFQAFSFHIDSMFCYMAHYAGVQETVLAPPCVTFHIEHSIGSGWSPEGHQALFARLEQAGIPSLENGQLREWGEVMKASSEPFIFNGEDWGLSPFALKQCSDPSPHYAASTLQPSATANPSADSLPIGSLRRELDFHKLQAQYLRRENQRLQMELKKAQTGLNLWWLRTSTRWKRSYHKRAVRVQHFLNALKRRRPA